MRNIGKISASLVLAGAVYATPVASAQATEEGEFGATATVEQPFLSPDRSDPSATVTRVELNGDEADLGEVLERVPGGSLIRTGGLGTFTGFSVRGLSLEQTSVSLEGMPLGQAGEAVDLSLFPASWFENVDVYRGGTPASFALAPVGGLVHLRLPDSREYQSRELDVRVTAGSFGTFGLSAASRVCGASGLCLHAAVSGQHTDGDYTFLQDNRTPLNPDDDEERDRQNAEQDQGAALLLLDAPALDGNLTVLLGLIGRTGGIAGSPQEEPLFAARRDTELLFRTGYASAGWEQSRPTSPRFRVGFGTTLSRKRFQDPLREISLIARASDDALLGLDLSSAGDVPVSDSLVIGAHLSYRLERRSPTDPLARNPNPASVRHQSTLGIEPVVHLRLGGGRVQIRPSVSILAAGADVAQEDASFATRSSDVFPNARLGLVLEPHRSWAVNASVSTGVRLPSFTELFGDRGYLVGSPLLRPERSLTAEMGIVADLQAGDLGLAFEARAFATSVKDLIRYVRNTQLRLVPSNLAEATTLGGEVRAVVTYADWAELESSVSLSDPTDRETGASLPLRPRFQWRLAPAVRFEHLVGDVSARLHLDVTHTGSTFANPQNRVEIPGRTLVGAQLAISPWEFFEVSLRLHDIFDVRPFDLVGYPLPGRRFTFSMRLNIEWT